MQDIKNIFIWLQDKLYMTSATTSEFTAWCDRKMRNKEKR